MSVKRLILFFLINVFLSYYWVSLSLYKSILMAVTLIVILTVIRLLFSVVEKVKK